MGSPRDDRGGCWDQNQMEWKQNNVGLDDKEKKKDEEKTKQGRRGAN